jgi:hypothetical protein
MSVYTGRLFDGVRDTWYSNCPELLLALLSESADVDGPEYESDNCSADDVLDAGLDGDGGSIAASFGADGAVSIVSTRRGVDVLNRNCRVTYDRKVHAYREQNRLEACNIMAANCLKAGKWGWMGCGRVVDDV